MRRTSLTLSLALAALAVTASVATAAPPNGGFEDGNFSHWKATSNGFKTSSELWILYTDATRKLALDYGNRTLPKPAGKHAAVFIQSEPSNGFLSTTFKVPNNANTLKMKLFWINPESLPTAGSTARSLRLPTPGPWYFQPTFNYRGYPSLNQRFSLDLIAPDAPASTTSKKDLLEHILSPTETTASTSGGWRNLTASVTRFQGQKVKLRLAAVDNVYFLNVGLDSVEFVNSDPVTG